uniref:Uncharacterized protein n=1 Tax=Anguilla anguilla TaxID=7936 RepID=A0A0E9VVX6_ANGAN
MAETTLVKYTSHLYMPTKQKV